MDRRNRRGENADVPGLVKTDGAAPKTGLVLGSGGARGLAHIGVLQALRERGVRPDVIVGSSIGAVMGAVLAEGRLDEVAAFAETLDVSKAAALFFEVGFHRDGLISGTRAMNTLRRFLPVGEIGLLPVRYAAVATDISTGREVVIERGDALEAVRASIAIPGVFTPVRADGKLLVDGGVSSPVPVAAARRLGADRVIAVNVDGVAPCPYRARRTEGSATARALDGILEKLQARVSISGESAADNPNMIEIIVKTLRIAEARLAAEELRRTPPDVLIEPAVGDIATLDFSRAKDAIRAGRDAAEAALES